MLNNECYDEAIIDNNFDLNQEIPPVVVPTLNAPTLAATRPGIHKFNVKDMSATVAQLESP